MATGYTSTISNTSSSDFSSKIRFKYTSVFDPATSTSTISLVAQYNPNVNLGNVVRFYRGSLGSVSAIYGGNSTSTSKLYSLSTTASGDYVLRSSSGGKDTWHSLTPYKGSIDTFTVKHDRDGNATIYCGAVGLLYAQSTSVTAKFLDSTTHRSGCQATITETAPYSITYDANGGSGAPESQPIYATYDYDLSTAEPTRDGYTFLGWSTSSTATTATYSPGQNVTPNDNLALYAVWESNFSGVCYIDNGTSFDSYEIYIDNGTTWDKYVPYIDNGTSWDLYS